jgi:nucleolin
VRGSQQVLNQDEDEEESSEEESEEDSSSSSADEDNSSPKKKTATPKPPKKLESSSTSDYDSSSDSESESEEDEEKKLRDELAARIAGLGSQGSSNMGLSPKAYRSGAQRGRSSEKENSKKTKKFLSGYSFSQPV